MDYSDPPPIGTGHIGDLRKAEFWRLMRHPLTIVAIIFGAVIGGAFGQFFGPALLVLGALLLPAFISLFVRLLAGRKATRAFFVAWAEGRGLTRAEARELQPVVPILGKGYSRGMDEAFSGTLESGLNGTVALYKYVTRNYSSDTDSDSEHPYTVVLTEVAETRAWLPELLVWKKSGPRAFEKLEDRMRGDHQRVEPRNDEMGKRYEVFVRKGQEELPVAELLSPTFVSWLTTSPPKGFAFELVDGWLCVYLPKYRNTTEELDGLISSTREVVQRLREESPS